MKLRKVLCLLLILLIYDKGCHLRPPRWQRGTGQGVGEGLRTHLSPQQLAVSPTWKLPTSLPPGVRMGEAALCTSGNYQLHLRPVVSWAVGAGPGRHGHLSNPGLAFLDLHSLPVLQLSGAPATCHLNSVQKSLATRERPRLELWACSCGHRPRPLCRG